jgi:hypothetical protein
MSTLKNQPKIVRCYRINYGDTLGEVAVLKASDLDIEPTAGAQNIVVVTLAESGRKLFGYVYYGFGCTGPGGSSMVVHLDGSPVYEQDDEEGVVLLQALITEGDCITENSWILTTEEAIGAGGWLCINMEETGIIKKLNCKLVRTQVEKPARIKVTPIKDDEKDEAA